MASTNSSRPVRRDGSAITLTAISLVPLLAMAAFAIDYGRLCVAKAELQRAADAAAMAGAWELLEAQTPGDQESIEAAEAAKDAAIEYAALNTSFGRRLRLLRSDVQTGFFSAGYTLENSSAAGANAVQVRLRRDQASNGALAMLFAGLIGTREAVTSASATATFINDVAGFEAPLDGRNLPILPFALDSETWQQAVNGEGPDEWRWDPASEEFVRGSDGVPEFNMYPQDTGSPGNRGTVNIGTSSNSTSHISRQISEGVSAEDLEHHGGRLQFDDNQQLHLGGDPGISAGFKDELDSIRGEGRVIPIFQDLEGNGGAGVYTITQWAGIRIAEVELTGGEKRVVAQAAKVVTGGALAGTGSGSGSQFVFSRVWICR